MIKSGPQKQRGVALLAALILMLAVVLILTNIFYRHQIDVSQASASLHGDQALLIAISGEGWAGELLSDKNDNRDVDDYGEIWAQAMPLLPVEGGTLKGCVSDLQGKINLNSFVTYRGSSLNNELNNFGTMGVAKAWLNLMDMLQIPASPDRVATIVDWVDSDSSVINSWGAEQPDYEGLTFPRMVANDFISDVTLLGLVFVNILHSLNGGNCFATLIGLVLLHAPIIIGATTFSKGLTAAYLKPLAMVGSIYLSILATFATPPIVLPPRFSVPLITGLAKYL